MDAIVRNGSLEDAHGLGALRWQSRSRAEQSLEAFESFEGRFVRWLRDALASQEWHVAVALDSELLVGCMYLRRVDTVPVPGVDHRAWGYVTHAFVAAEFRNRGIGRAMLARLVSMAEALRLTELHVWPSQRAISLYARAGFLSPEKQRQGTPPDEPSYVLPIGPKLP